MRMTDEQTCCLFIRHPVFVIRNFVIPFSSFIILKSSMHEGSTQ